MKKALITGISGQDGSYLTEFLLQKGYEVHGIVRRETLSGGAHKLWRINSLLDRVTLHEGSIEDYLSLRAIIEKVRPDECYHLASQSFVSYALKENEVPAISSNIDGTLYLLSILKEAVPVCRFYFAGSSEMFGLADQSPQDEATRFRPRSLYGIAKISGYYLTQNYRDVYGLFACSGILYNHESPRRGMEFVTRKITNAVAEIKLGLNSELRLGNLQARRDWGFAKDYVEAMWLMLQQDQPDDYVIASGVTHSVEEFVDTAFSSVGLNWRDYVVVDEQFYRPGEKYPLCGNFSKAARKLGWQPRKGFKEVVQMMAAEDLKRVRERSISLGNQT